jgi:hypothetical protein
VNVKEYEAPAGSESEENAAGDPVSEAIMWGTLSCFVHVTVVPVFTASEAGSNAKFLIAMVFPPPVATGGAAVAGVDWEEAQPAITHARTKRTVHPEQNIQRESDGMIS